MAEYNVIELKELLEEAGDCINIPDLMEVVKGLSGNIEIIGGAMEQCLREVEIAFQALGIPYKLKSELVYEKTLYHGTNSDVADDIRKYGLFPITGDFVKQMYDLSDDEAESNDGYVFAADKKNIEKAVSAMLFHVGKKVNKHMLEVTFQEIVRYGLLTIIKNQDRNFIQAPDDETFEKISSQAGFPNHVEPGDYVSQNTIEVDTILRGTKLLKFLKKYGGNIMYDLRDKESLNWKKGLVVNKLIKSGRSREEALKTVNKLDLNSLNNILKLGDKV